MNVSVTLLARLKKYASGKVDENGTVTLPEDATVQKLLSCLSIPVSRGTVVLVNGKRRGENDRLVAGDDIKILSMAGGG